MALKVLGGVGPLRGSLLGSNELPRREHCPLDDAPPFSSRDGVGWRSSAAHSRSSARSFQRLFKDSPDFSLSLPMQSPSSLFGLEDWRKKASQLQAVNEAGDAADLKAFCRPLNMESSFRSHSSCDQKKTLFHSPNEHVYPLHASSSGIGTSGGVPVYVMLPLDSVNPNNTLNRRRALHASLLALKSAGAEGIMVDVWWGLVERDTPGQYNWAGYRELMEMVKLHGLKAQAVMSFHQCGGNVGDSCHIPLPQWVLQEMKANPDIVYTDKSERRNQEYLSLGCDTFPVLKGRTPVQAYADFMRSFRDAFHDLLGETIVEIQVGMGPAGELRYPAYPESNGTWRFPGIGEFQCYDKYMIASLKACADRLGKREWGLGGPHNAGHYTQWPDETGFFHRDGSWNSPYGNFFLEWYSEMLLAHGHRILSSAASIFRGTGVKLSGKVAGIHWHYGTRSHAAELTAGYYNTRNRDGYLPVAQMFGRHGVTLNFTCFEMRDTEQPPHAQSCPEGLLNQVTLVSRKARVHLAGENALPRYDEAAHHQVIRNSRLQLHHSEKGYEPLCSFTFLRMNERLFHSENWSRFVWFVRQMAEGRTIEHWEEEHRHTEIHVNTIKPLRMEAAAALMHS